MHEMTEKHFVYVLKAGDATPRYYVGITCDPARRLIWHNQGHCTAHSQNGISTDCQNRGPRLQPPQRTNLRMCCHLPDTLPKVYPLSGPAVMVIVRSLAGNNVLASSAPT